MIKFGNKVVTYNNKWAKYDGEPPGPVISEVWCYINRIPSGESGKIIQVYNLKLNDVAIIPSIVEGKQAQLQTWYDDTDYAYQFNDNDNCYSPQRSDTESIRFKLPTMPSDNDVISYGPYDPYWCYDATCQVNLVGLDINGNEYLITNSSYNQTTYFNNNKQRVELTYINPV